MLVRIMNNIESQEEKDFLATKGSLEEITDFEEHEEYNEIYGVNQKKISFTLKRTGRKCNFTDYDKDKIFKELGNKQY